MKNAVLYFHWALVVAGMCMYTRENKFQLQNEIIYRELSA